VVLWRVPMGDNRWSWRGFGVWLTVRGVGYPCLCLSPSCVPDRTVSGGTGCEAKGRTGMDEMLREMVQGRNRDLDGQRRLFSIPRSNRHRNGTRPPRSTCRSQALTRKRQVRRALSNPKQEALTRANRDDPILADDIPYTKILSRQVKCDGFARAAS